MINQIKRKNPEGKAILEDIGVKAVNVEEDPGHRLVTDEQIADWSQKVDSTGPSSDTTVIFSEAETRENIKSGESQKILFGKIRKYFSDLKRVAFSNDYNDLDNKLKIADNDTTNDAGYLATARVAYEHGNEIDQLKKDMTDQLNEVTITYEDGYFYANYNGVKKKLGNPDIHNKSFSGTTSDNPTINFTVEGKVLFAGVTSASFTVYSWEENYNHWAGASVSCSWSGNTISVHLSGGNSTSGSRGASVTVYYCCE